MTEPGLRTAGHPHGRRGDRQGRGRPPGLPAARPARSHSQTGQYQRQQLGGGTHQDTTPSSTPAMAARRKGWSLPPPREQAGRRSAAAGMKAPRMSPAWRRSLMVGAIATRAAGDQADGAGAAEAAAELVDQPGGHRPQDQVQHLHSRVRRFVNRKTGRRGSRATPPGRTPWGAQGSKYPWPAATTWRPGSRSRNRSGHSVHRKPHGRRASTSVRRHGLCRRRRPCVG